MICSPVQHLLDLVLTRFLGLFAELCVAKIWLHEHSGSANQNAPMWQVHEISWGVDEMTNMTVGQSLTSCKS